MKLQCTGVAGEAAEAAFAAELRDEHLLDPPTALSDERFVISVAGERLYVPARAKFNIEHERGADEEEIEFQVKWSADA